MAKRTDCHRPGEINPAAYEIETWYIAYTAVDEWPMAAAVRAECERLRGIDKAHAESGGKVFGALGKCGVCGACFKYGDVWVHTNGDRVHMGHDCAAKYELLASRPGFDAAKESFQKGLRAHHKAQQRAVVFAEYMAAFPKLAEALETDHYISRDLKEKARLNGSLTDAQVSLAFKLQRETSERAKREAERALEVNVPSPVGRKEVLGRVVSVKSVDTDWGTVSKMVVKVETSEGVWLAYGSIPSNVTGWQTYRYSDLRGDLVEFTATFEKGKEAHFGFFKRPANARRVCLPEA